MLCPCCGFEAWLSERECSCGARIVGNPLDETPLKVRRFGPLMIAVGSALAVATASAAISPWFAAGAAAVIWFALRARRRAKQDSELFGGYRTASATLGIAILAFVAFSYYAVYSFNRYEDNCRIRDAAATRATMFQTYEVVQDFRTETGYLPFPQEKVGLPLDSWQNRMRYREYTDAVADASAGAPLDNFELRSAGPDGIMDTADDLVMRDGVFLTSEEVAKKPPLKAATRP